MPTNLLYLCNSPEVPAGVEKTVLMLLKHIDRQRFSPRVILNGEGPFADTLRRHDEDVEVIPCAGRISRKWLRSLRESFQHRPADVVQLNLSRLNARHLRKWGCRIVERLNMIRHSSFMYPMRCRPVDRWTSRWIDHFIVVSQSLKQQFVERGYPEGKLSVVYNGVQVPGKRVQAPGEGVGEGEQVPGEVDGDVLKKELRLSSKDRIVGAVGRLTEQKGIDTFISAAKIVGEQMPNIRFIIAGEGSLRSRLETLASKSGIGDRIHFLGFREDIFDVLSSLDVLVYLSRWEPFANTVLEAMAVRTPVIASDVGGNAEIIADGDNGILVPPDDAPAAADAVIRLLGNSSLIQQIQSAARATAEEFSVKRMVDGHETIYSRLGSVR